MIANHLAQFRQRRGIAAADLAQRVGVSRHTIYAIESGAYVPNTAIALRLARELELPAMQAFLDVLQHAALRRKLEIVAGYKTSKTGGIVV